MSLLSTVIKTNYFLSFSITFLFWIDSNILLNAYKTPCVIAQIFSALKYTLWLAKDSFSLFKINPPFSRSLYFSIIKVDIAEDLDVDVRISDEVDWDGFNELIWSPPSIRFRDSVYARSLSSLDIKWEIVSIGTP